ncbi:MAG: Hsp20/alpha crystallin family protein [Kutzneria sp.]|nr:Hsp20/alpha crystallin family protein [Kutzneria sp.]
MATHTDPFRQLERLTRHMFGTDGAVTRLATMPMDAYRSGDEFVVSFDLPGVAAESIDLNVERNVLTVRAERPAVPDGQVRWQIAERPRGTLFRQIVLGESLDSDRIQARYDAGTLTVRIPVSTKAQPRKIEINRAEQPQAVSA